MVLHRPRVGRACIDAKGREGCHGADEGGEQDEPEIVLGRNTTQDAKHGSPQQLASPSNYQEFYQDQVKYYAGRRTWRESIGNQEFKNSQSYVSE